MNTIETRKIVKAILLKHELANKFSVRIMNTLDINREFTTVVTVLNWVPCGLADQVKREIMQQTNAIVLFR